MKQGWEIKKLGEVCLIGDGNYSSKYPKASEFVSKGVPFLTATNLKNGTIVPDGIRFISKEQHSSLTKGHVIKNDLVIVVRGSSTGNNSIVPAEYEGSNLNSQLAFLRVKDNNTDSGYIFSVFNSPEVQKVVLNTISGAAQPQLPNNKLLNIEIPLPPLPEQQRIVSILDEAFVAIAKAKANAEQNLRNAKELFESYLQGVFEKKGDGWINSTIGETCKLLTGGTPSTTKKEYFEGGNIKWLVSGDINQKEIFDCEGRITQLGLENSNARYLPDNSVLIALNGQGKTRGTVAMLRTKATCNQSLVCIYPNDINKVLPELIFANLDGRYNEIRKLTGDSGNDRRGLNMPIIRNISFSYPKSIDEQKIIVRKLDDIKAETKKLEAIYQQKINDLEELKKSILQNAFNGELKTNKVSLQ